MTKLFSTLFLFIFIPITTALAEELVEDNAALVKEECRRIGSKLGSVSIQDCLSIGLSATDGRSIKNAPILL